MEILKKLISYIIEEPHIESDDLRSFKFPFVASEILKHLPKEKLKLMFEKTSKDTISQISHDQLFMFQGKYSVIRPNIDLKNIEVGEEESEKFCTKLNVGLQEEKGIEYFEVQNSQNENYFIPIEELDCNQEVGFCEFKNDKNILNSTSLNK